MGITSRLTHAFVAPLVVTLVAATAPFQAHAEEPIKTNLDASNIQNFAGNWSVAMELMGNIMNFDMSIVDIDGKAGATFDSQRQPEPIAVEEMRLLDDGALELTYDMPFGAQTFSLVVTARLSTEGLEGEINEKSGLFKAPFTAKEAVDDVETREQRRRNRMISATAATLRFDSEKVVITFADLKTESDDYKVFQSLSDDAVFEYVGGRACKILTDLDLHFGDEVVKQGNAHETYPGVYSLWMKKSADGWKLVFNEEADVWGTMFNPDTQVHEVALTESAAEETTDSLKMTLDKVDDTTGTLNILWADKKYSVSFTAKAKTEASPS